MRQEPFVTVYARVGLDAGGVIKELCSDYQMNLSKLMDTLFAQTRDDIERALDKAVAKDGRVWLVDDAKERREARRHPAPAQKSKPTKKHKRVVRGPQMKLKLAKAKARRG